MPELALERKQTFLEMVDTFDQLWQMAEECGDEQEHQTVLAEIERMLVEDFASKTDGVGGFLKHCESKVALRRDWMQQCQADKQAWERRYDKMREIALLCVSRLPDKKIRGEIYNFAVHDSGRRGAKVTDMGLLPLEYCTVSQPSLHANMAKIIGALERGIEVPGAELEPPKDVLYIRGNARLRKGDAV
jgi:hypothetical protein